MSQAPVFAVVGHPNKGKSSIVATLSQNDAIAIALEPGTTRRSHAYPLQVDGQVLYTLVDTPGFQRPRRVLEWLEAHSVSASDRAATVAAFVTQHRGNSQFSDECELLAPLIEGAGIIYVVDGSVPYSPQHEAEMTILRWTGRPSLALINSIGDEDYGDTWQAALGQFFQVVRKFDAVRAPFEQHLSLLKAFGQLEPAWEKPLETATGFLDRQRQQRRQHAATLIAQTLQQMMGYRHSRSLAEDLAASASSQSKDSLASELRKSWYQHQRRREQQLRGDIQQLYQHGQLQRQEAELEWQSEHDLFSEDSRQLWGVNKGYLAGAGFGAGAIGGIGIDALTLGASFGTGALIGGIIGAAGSYFYGDRLPLPTLKIGPLRDGVKTASFGPVPDTQFGYVVLGRALNHWWHVSHRNHAGRAPLALGTTDSHWLEGLSKPDRNILHRAMEKARKGKAADPSDQHKLGQVIIHAMKAYNDWELKSI
jgi:small GTP-binding protein